MVQAEQSVRTLGLLAGIKHELDIAQTGLVINLSKPIEGTVHLYSKHLTAK